VSHALAVARLSARLLFAKPITVQERVRDYVALDGREAGEVAQPQLAAKPRLDAGDAEIVILAQAQLTVPNPGAEQAVITGLYDKLTPQSRQVWRAISSREKL
jgi:hypothetical protein